MSIESTRLVVGSAKRDGIGGRETPPPVCIKIIPVDPRTTTQYLVSDGSVAFTAPDCVGQIVAYQDPAAAQFVRLFIASTFSTWVPVNMASFLIDTRTGKPYDPNAEFYNPLAS